MGRLNKDNLRKTYYYLKKNGLKNTMYAIAERMQKRDTDSYTYVSPAESVLKKQRERKWEKPVTFSILVPLYHTPELYFTEMVESVLCQTYPHFQLILLDAGDDNALEELAAGYGDDRVCYHKLAENKGIAENTNAGIPYATGDYIALLDHDDTLTADALYEFAAAIEAEKKRGVELKLLYSDEDKCDGEAVTFYEPHYKLDFNLDLLLTNNYICHFTAVAASVFRKLKLRGEYNGAQDFDLVLRVAGMFLDKPQVIWHVPKVLYHWRCHRASTAVNPASKTYAYEAGKRAVEDFVKQRGWKARVEHLKHLGFYRVIYEADIFAARKDVAAVGGSLLGADGKLVGGIRDAAGVPLYEGLRYGFSGYMNRAALVQQAEVLDIRCLVLNPACQRLLEKSLQKFGLTWKDYQEIEVTSRLAKEEPDFTQLSVQMSNDLRGAGYCLIWDARWVKPYEEKVCRRKR